MTYVLNGIDLSSTNSVNDPTHDLQNENADWYDVPAGVFDRLAYSSYARQNISAHSLGSVQAIHKLARNDANLMGGEILLGSMLGIQRRPHSADKNKRRRPSKTTDTKQLLGASKHAMAAKDESRYYRSAVQLEVDKHGSSLQKPKTLEPPANPYKEDMNSGYFGGRGKSLSVGKLIFQPEQCPIRGSSGTRLDPISRRRSASSAVADLNGKLVGRLPDKQVRKVGLPRNTYIVPMELRPNSGASGSRSTFCVTKVSLRPSSRPISASTRSTSSRPRSAASSGNFNDKVVPPHVESMAQSFPTPLQQRPESSPAAALFPFRSTSSRPPSCASGGRAYACTPPSLRPPTILPLRPHSRDSGSGPSVSLNGSPHFQESIPARTDVNLIWATCTSQDDGNRTSNHQNPNSTVSNPGGPVRGLVWLHRIIRNTGSSEAVVPRIVHPPDTKDTDPNSLLLDAAAWSLRRTRLNSKRRREGRPTSAKRVSFVEGIDGMPSTNHEGKEGSADCVATNVAGGAQPSNFVDSVTSATADMSNQTQKVQPAAAPEPFEVVGVSPGGRLVPDKKHDPKVSETTETSKRPTVRGRRKKVRTIRKKTRPSIPVHMKTYRVGQPNEDSDEEIEHENVAKVNPPPLIKMTEEADQIRESRPKSGDYIPCSSRPNSSKSRVVHIQQVVAPSPEYLIRPPFFPNPPSSAPHPYVIEPDYDVISHFRPISANPIRRITVKPGVVGLRAQEAPSRIPTARRAKRSTPMDLYEEMTLTPLEVPVIPKRLIRSAQMHRRRQRSELASASRPESPQMKELGKGETKRQPHYNNRFDNPELQHPTERELPSPERSLKITSMQRYEEEIPRSKSPPTRPPFPPRDLQAVYPCHPRISFIPCVRREEEFQEQELEPEREKTMAFSAPIELDEQADGKYRWIENAIASTHAIYRPVEEYKPEAFMSRHVKQDLRLGRVTLTPTAIFLRTRDTRPTTVINF